MLQLDLAKKQFALETTLSDNMGYPDAFEGFVVNSQKDWTTFKKQELR